MVEFLSRDPKQTTEQIVNLNLLADFESIATRTWIVIKFIFLIIFKVLNLHLVVENGHFYLKN